MTSNLEPYGLTEHQQTLIRQSFSQPFPPEIQGLEPFKKRPKPSELRNRLIPLSLRADLSSEPDVVMRAVYRSINRSWEAYTEGSVGCSDFMRTPFGAAYQVVTIKGKGRGIIASRDIAAGEAILQETPVLVAPFESSNFLLFLLLPQKAIESILLLHNAHTEDRRFSLQQDIPLHRLLDIFSGIMSTNSFSATAPYGRIGILLLTGSLFNHSNTPNVAHTWDAEKEKDVFVSLRDVKKGEELVHDYIPGVQGRTRREKLKQYGI